MTNGDRFRSMDNKELAEMIANHMPCSNDCPCYENCIASNGYECKRRIEHWLKQEEDE